MQQHPLKRKKSVSCAASPRLRMLVEHVRHPAYCAIPRHLCRTQPPAFLDCFRRTVTSQGHDATPSVDTFLYFPHPHVRRLQPRLVAVPEASQLRHCGAARKPRTRCTQILPRRSMRRQIPARRSSPLRPPGPRPLAHVRLHPLELRRRIFTWCSHVTPSPAGTAPSPTHTARRNRQHSLR